MKNKSAEGLRGIACFNVAVHHFVAAFLPMMLHEDYPNYFAENTNQSCFFEILTSPFISIFYNGHFAVLIFFVLSGYVLTLPFFNASIGSKKILEERLWGRYLRLNVPIATAILVSYFFYKCGLYSNIQAADISGSVHWLKTFYPEGIAAMTAVKEVIYGSIVFGNGTLLPPLWVLKIEFIGSLYILLYYISKPSGAIFTPLLMVVCLIYLIHPQDSIYYFAIFAGSFLSYSKSVSRYRAIIFILGIYFGGFQFDSAAYDYLPSVWFLEIYIWNKKTFYNAVGAVLLTLSVIQGFGLKIFESRFFQFLGKISFSLYLIHFIILCSLSSFVYTHLPQSKLFLGINFALYLIVCFLVSIIFERIIDQRAISMSHEFSSKMFS